MCTIILTYLASVDPTTVLWYFPSINHAILFISCLTPLHCFPKAVLCTMVLQRTKLCNTSQEQVRKPTMCVYNVFSIMHCTCMHIHIHMYVCMYVWMYVCMYESFCCIYGEEYLEEIPFCIFFPYFLDKLCSQYDNIRKGFYKSHCSMLDLFKHTEVSLFIRLWMQKWSASKPTLPLALRGLDEVFMKIRYPYVTNPIARFL